MRFQFKGSSGEQPIKLKRIERWAAGEGPNGPERFREFHKQLRSRKM